VLVSDAMPHLSGKRVLDFMPKLIGAAGKEQVAFEVQGPDGELRPRQAPLAVYLQELQRSSPGRAYFMASDAALRRAALAEFLAPPSCALPDLLAELPEPLRPPGAQDSRYLLMGGRGATSRLRRIPVTCCTWSLLVLGRMRWHLLPPSTPAAALGAEVGDWGTCTSAMDSFAEAALARAPEGNSESVGPSWPPGSELWEATQEIGEVLLLPPGWWSQAHLEDRSLMVGGPCLPEALLPVAAQEVARWTGECEQPGGPPGSPREALERAVAQLGHGLECRRPELPSALQSAGRSGMVVPSPRPVRA